MSAARLGRRNRIEIKTPEQLALMRVAGLVVAGALEAVVAHLRPGCTTADLDHVAREYLADHAAVPSFLGYHGFPAVICTSVNDQIVHGIPGDLVIAEGDLVSIDCGAIVQGWHGDAAVTAAVGEVSQAERDLLAVTEGALWQGLAAAVVGGRLSDIGHAVESWVRPRGEYGIVEEYVGHGIGTAMHMEPSVPNYGSPGHGPALVAGMALAVEPMVNLGTRRTRELEDGWTVVTADGARSAHFEHTVALTEAGPWVLTAADGGAARFAAMGVATPAPGSGP
jgi:methionyl aminopeptidase